MRKTIRIASVGWIFFLIFLPINAATATASDPPDRPIEIIDVSPSVTMVLNDHGSNITCIALDSGLVFVDAGLSTDIARRFRTSMEERFQRPTQSLVLTHGHLDHIFGMGAFADVDIIASEVGRPLIEKQLAIDWTEEKIAIYAGIFPTFADDIEGAKPRLPTMWVAENLTLGNDRETATFRVNGGHTNDSSHVYFPSEGVLVSGDLVQVDKFPYFGDPTNDLNQWIQVLKQWHSWPVTKVCPGHGRVVERDYLALMQQYFENLQHVLTNLNKANLAVEEVVIHQDLPKGYWPDQQEPRWWKMCLARAFSSIEST